MHRVASPQSVQHLRFKLHNMSVVRVDFHAVFEEHAELLPLNDRARIVLALICT